MNKEQIAEQIAIKHIGKVYWNSFDTWKKVAIVAAIAEAMSINSENVYTKNPCDENVNMSGTRNDAQRYTADNQEAIEPKGDKEEQL